MNNEKLENLLNLSLEATQREREKSEELEIGYEKSTNTWELIVKYSGDISHLEDLERGIIIEKLSNEYAIIRSCPAGYSAHILSAGIPHRLDHSSCYRC